MHAWLLFVPFLSAFIGWLLTKLGIWLLFNPREPRKLAGFTFHGWVFRRYKKSAPSLAAALIDELFTRGNIREKMQGNLHLQSILPLIESHIDDFLRNKLGKSMPMIGMFIGDKTINELKVIFMQELEEIFPMVMTAWLANPELENIIRENVRERILAFPSDKLERSFHLFFSDGLKKLEIAGILFGLFIGLIQLLYIFIMVQ